MNGIRTKGILKMMDDSLSFDVFVVFFGFGTFLHGPFLQGLKV